MVQISGPISLELLDPPDVNQTQFGPDMKRWLAVIVDTLNDDITSLQNDISFFITSAGVDIGGSGAGPISVPVIGLTSDGFVNVNLISSTNPVTVLSVVPTTNAFDITFSGDPGASAIIVYQAYTERPQV